MDVSSTIWFQYIFSHISYATHQTASNENNKKPQNCIKHTDKIPRKSQGIREAHFSSKEKPKITINVHKCQYQFFFNMNTSFIHFIYTVRVMPSWQIHNRSAPIYVQNFIMLVDWNMSFHACYFHWNGVLWLKRPVHAMEYVL